MILFQIFEDALPFVAFTEDQCLFRLFTVCQQDDRDRSRAKFRFILGIFPDLGDRDIDRVLPDTDVEMEGIGDITKRFALVGINGIAGTVLRTCQRKVGGRLLSRQFLQILIADRPGIALQFVSLRRIRQFRYLEGVIIRIEFIEEL